MSRPTVNREDATKNVHQNVPEVTVFSHSVSPAASAVFFACAAVIPTALVCRNAAISFAAATLSVFSFSSLLVGVAASAYRETKSNG